jgi:uncharacterized repeat protein (TIGR03803 family)
MDAAGSLYGATRNGGDFAQGVVFELMPDGNGQWTYSVLHNFTGESSDGGQPRADLIFDGAGNLYGTGSVGGGGDCGVVFKLTPAGGAWNESKILDLCSIGGATNPMGDLIFDSAGNLYGTTQTGGQFFSGTVSRDVASYVSTDTAMILNVVIQGKLKRMRA